MRAAFDGPMMAVVRFTRATGAKTIADGLADFIGYGQPYIANPDLERRFEMGWPLDRPRFDNYYTQGAEGYTDYPRYEDSALTDAVPVDEYPLGV